MKDYRVVGKIAKLESSFKYKTFQLNDPSDCPFQLQDRLSWTTNLGWAFKSMLCNRGFLLAQIRYLLSPSWKASFSYARFILANLNPKMIFQECPGRSRFTDFTLYLRINRIIGWRICSSRCFFLCLSSSLSMRSSVSVALSMMIMERPHHPSPSDSSRERVLLLGVLRAIDRPNIYISF